MEVDTGRTVSVMNITEYNRHFKNITLQPIERRVHAYSGTQLDIAGQIKVHVNYNSQEATLPILVINADTYTPPVFRRDWLSVIKLDWHTLFATGQYSIPTGGVDVG